MSIILQNLATPTIEEAIEANFNEEMARLGYRIGFQEFCQLMHFEWSPGT
jgi:hypothetical protein